MLRFGGALGGVYVFSVFVLNIIWGTLHEDSFFYFCNVTPGSSAACVQHKFEPPLGIYSFNGKSTWYVPLLIHLRMLW